MTQTLNRVSAVDPEQYPFRAQLDYDEYGEQSGLMASNEVEILMAAVGRGAITENSKKVFNQHAFDLIRAFVEYGYQSRQNETITVKASQVKEMIGEAALSGFGYVYPEVPRELEEAPLLVYLSLMKVARRSYLWGRTGDPHDPTGFGETSVLSVQ